MLRAGLNVNVIPSTAEAVIDIRMLPDEDLPALMAGLSARIGDSAITIEPLAVTRPVAPPSPVDSSMYRALERAALRVYPGTTVLPSMMNGATDMAQLRAKGVSSYGVGPAMTSDDFVQHGWHSDVERLSEASLYQFVEFLWTAVIEVAAKK